MNSIGEYLTKTARHHLTKVCLQGIKKELKELKDMGITHNSRGRPPSPEARLALKMGVTPKTTKRWSDFRDIQSNDDNTSKLVELAYNYDSTKTTEILHRDILIYQTIIESWLSEAEANIG
jgi:hypothetical protein